MYVNELMVGVVVLGHRDFALGTGQVIPVLVKIVKVIGVPPVVKPAPWQEEKTCSEPPPKN